jgi:hypothetical protein
MSGLGRKLIMAVEPLAGKGIINSHGIASFYETIIPHEAMSLPSRLER